MLKRSSQGHLVSFTKRFAAVKTYAQFKAHIATNQFTDALLAMTAADRTAALAACIDAYKRCEAKAPIPKQGTVRVKAWNDAMIAKLRQAEARFGNDDDIARHLSLPLKATRSARLRYCGRRRLRNQPHSSGAAAT